MDDNRNKKPIAEFFIDGQNLYFSAKSAFGYNQVNYDVKALAEAICLGKGWECGKIHFYTGVPTKEHDQRGLEFWTKKLAVMARQGIDLVTRPLKYRTKKEYGPDGVQHMVSHATEKGIDVKLALDMVRSAYEKRSNVIVLFSQDQDLREACVEVNKISRSDNRPLGLYCAFPDSPQSNNRRGISGVNWITIEKEIYDLCRDRRDYRRENTISEPSITVATPRPKIELKQPDNVQGIDTSKTSDVRRANQAKHFLKNRTHRNSSRPQIKATPNN